MLQLLGVVVDCPDPLALARFYAEVTGRPLMAGSDEDSAGIAVGTMGLTFQRVEHHRAPGWPDAVHPKQFHLDLEVDDLEAEQRRVVGLGATLRHDAVGPDGHGWRVYTDPAGHPFCLCRHEGVAWVDGRAVWPADG
ncbi:MAG: hypothetical protein JWN17_1379 [Frankiales bacterium]|nr:hypothetical protein [Frankiales bacterium]